MTSKDNQYLEDKQLSSLYSQTSQDLPSKQIDKAILATAKRASRFHTVGPFSSNWRVPASLAAVLVISVGLVTFIEDDLNGLSGVAPESIVPEIKLKRSKSNVTPEIASIAEPLIAQSPAISSDEIMKQGLTKNLIKKQQRNRPSKKIEVRAKKIIIPSLSRIKALRLAGDIDAANQNIDLFIRKHFGEKLDLADVSQITLSNKEWKLLISELRQLSRKELARKLEKLLMQRSKN